MRICPWPHGHLQAVGTDDVGRRHYLYHDAWREQRDRQKFARARDFGRRCRLYGPASPTTSPPAD